MVEGARIHCPRVERPRTVLEHLSCLYCFGSARDVESGERRRFCDFDRAVDPIVFGFPDRLSRFRAG